MLCDVSYGCCLIVLICRSLMLIVCCLWILGGGLAGLLWRSVLVFLWVGRLRLAGAVVVDFALPVVLLTCDYVV